MALLIIAYPNLKQEDYQKIQSFRKQYDERYYSVVEPHFTFVFPTDNISEKDLEIHVKQQLNDEKKFDFSIRRAIVNKDPFSDYYYVFLVPDQGTSNIIKLHDKLYTGPLASQLRLDIDFIPHIGIASSTDPVKCKGRTDEWNRSDFEISGSITHLTMINYENGIVEKLADFEL